MPRELFAAHEARFIRPRPQSAACETRFIGRRTRSGARKTRADGVDSRCCSTPAPHLLHTCSAPAPHLLRTCSTVVVWTGAFSAIIAAGRRREDTTMDKSQRRKHKAHKRSLVVCNQQVPVFDATAGGKKSLGKLATAVDTQAGRISDQENSRSQHQQASARADEARRILTKGLRHVSKVSGLLLDDSTPTFEGSRPPNDEQLIGRVDAIL